MPIHRRDFLSGTAALAGMTLTGANAFAAAGKSAADIRVGVVGVHGRGRDHLRGLGKHVTAICDADVNVLNDRVQKHGEKTGVMPTKYSDYREMLEKADIDAVSIATPNHTHCLIAIAAVEAGKDVYCEKPISHNVWEGRQLVAAARKHNRIVQCGTQSRSSPSLQQAVAWVQSGKLGKIEYALGTCYKPRKPIGKLEQPLDIPEAINYDLWCGPAEKRALYRPKLHYDWHWDLNTGNGDMGNQGIHQMDIARWFLGEKGLAPRTLSIGGRLGYDDAGDTPNTQVVLHDYESAPLIFETRGLPRSKQAQRNWGRMMDRYRGSGIGVVIQCEDGYVVVPSYTDAIAYSNDGTKLKEWHGGGNHYANWLQAIAAGDSSMLAAEIQQGHISSSLCHVGCASHILGEQMVADEIARKVASDSLLSASFDRMTAHLRANDVNVDSDEQALTYGAWLDVDTVTERFAVSGSDVDTEPLFKRAGSGEFVISDYNV